MPPRASPNGEDARVRRDLEPAFEPATLAAMPEQAVCELEILRHGDVAGSEHRSARGQLDVPLSARGRAQHLALVDDLARGERPLQRVFTSDLSRCRDLAERLAERCGAALETSKLLREQSLGSWQGRDWEEITRTEGATVNAYWADFLEAHPPGGESWREMAQRVHAFWQGAWPRAAGHRVAVVAHVGPIRALLCRLTGLPPAEALRMAPGVGTRTRLWVSEAGGVLERLGERPPPVPPGGALEAPDEVRAHFRDAAARPGLRIALSGSAGTGKTSLGRALSGALRLPLIEEGMRERLRRGANLHALSSAGLRGLILELWEEQEARESAETSWLAERSSLDFAAFWLHYGLTDDVRATGSFLERMRAHAERYTHVLLFPWGVIPLEDDGVRTTNPWIQLRFHSLVESLLQRWSPPGALWRVPASESFDERLSAALAAVLAPHAGAASSLAEVPR